MSIANAMNQPLFSAKAPEADVVMIGLAERDRMEPGLRNILQGMLDICVCGLELRLSETLNEFEKQLVRLADKATIHQQNVYFDSVHELKRGRPEIASRFMRSLENALARLGDDVSPSSMGRFAASSGRRLTLTDGVQLDESLVLSDIATKVVLRVREPLFALGHRFGALAGTERIVADVIPLGPRSIAEALQYAAAKLDIALDHRLVLYRCFERVVMNQIETLYATLNHFLAEQGVLPTLHTLPIDGNVASIAASPRTTAKAEETRPVSPIVPTPTPAPRLVAAPYRAPARNDFGALRSLWSECRRAGAYTASGEELQTVLTVMQMRQEPAAADAPSSLRSADDIRQEMLALLHERCKDGRMPRIGEEDSDVIDLTAMLFEVLERRSHGVGIAHWILARLEVPVLRAALLDQRFFSDRTHPARGLLNDFVEAALFWIDENEGVRDGALVETVQRLVNQVASEPQIDTAVFTSVRQDLSRHIEGLVRRVDLAERRQVEAAAGRDKLERCRTLAADAIAVRLSTSKPNEFLRTLLERGWVDVLTITLLRDGEDSASYSRCVELVDQLLAAAGARELQQDLPLLTDLCAQLESGLKQVGLHEDDVRAIVHKLFAQAADTQPENPISQTELAMKLRLKTPVGGKHPADFRHQPSQLQEDAASLEPAERAALDRLHAIEPGAWFEFKINAAGDTVRRKLAWSSRESGRCLLINQRGVPCETQTLPELAREIAGDRACLAAGAREPLVDQAWAAICDTLGNFSGRKREAPVPIRDSRKQATEQPSRDVGKKESAHSHEPRTLLLVDDEVNIQRALTRVFRDEGYRILSASSAAEAMDLLGQNEVHVIISDQRMPVVCGTDFLNKVRAVYPDTIGILLSGYSDVAAVTDAINRGAIYKFLTKPWNDADIRLQVRDAFEAAERNRACAPVPSEADILLNEALRVTAPFQAA